MVECSIYNCNGKHRAKGLCIKHYKQTPEYKQKALEYTQRPEVRKRINERAAISRKTLEYREKRRIYQRSPKYKEYVKSISDKRLKIMTRHFEKYGKPFDMNSHEYKWALQVWGDAVKQRDYNKCLNCKESNNLHAHHVLEKSDYPEFSLVLSNGITLCRSCHLDIHRRDKIW